jgi:hypothetical protein
LALAEAEPELQKELKIIELGSVGHDSHDLPVVALIMADIYNEKNRRLLFTNWSSGTLWSNSYRFLAVCKENK